MYCKDCKYWNKKERPTRAWPKMKTCRNKKIIEIYTDCCMQEFISTLPNFGCILWEKKNEN